MAVRLGQQRRQQIYALFFISPRDFFPRQEGNRDGTISSKFETQIVKFTCCILRFQVLGTSGVPGPVPFHMATVSHICSVPMVIFGAFVTRI